MTHSIYRGSDQNYDPTSSPQALSKGVQLCGQLTKQYTFGNLLQILGSAYTIAFMPVYTWQPKVRLSTIAFTPLVSNTITLHFTTQYTLETSYKLGSALTIAFMPVYT